MNMPPLGTSRKHFLCPTGHLGHSGLAGHMGDMLPNNIAMLRKAAKLSQTELAEKIGTSLNMMGKLERGARSLTADWIEKIADALAVEPFRLIAPERLFPSEEQLTEMLLRAQQTLPAGLPYSEWPRVVASGLHTRLLTLAGDRASAESVDRP